MDKLLNVSSSPHVCDKSSTKSIMRDVVIALIPATLVGIGNFGVRALLVVLTTCASAVLAEYIWQRCMKQPITTSDFSALLTGLLLALNLPATVPWWIPVIGGVFAILVVKQLFGGIGQNFMNPALGARCFLLISFAGRMTDFTYDGISGATPLTALKMGEPVNLMDMFLGNKTGSIGEVSVLAVLIGAVILLLAGVIDLRIPGTYLLSFLFFILVFGGHGADPEYLLGQLFGGGLMLGAFFMATDYVTTPITKHGQLVYGCILGILTGIFRVYGNSAAGVSYAIIFGNLLVPLIEKVTLPRAFGKGGKKA